MGVGIYYFYHGFGLKAFEGRHIRIYYKFRIFPVISYNNRMRGLVALEALRPHMRGRGATANKELNTK